eukprot:m.44263 g.44263  ORF g.44263 m.44263 type:complete len:56 (-) comp13000_c0_seq1:3-170(-)
MRCWYCSCMATMLSWELEAKEVSAYNVLVWAINEARMSGKVWFITLQTIMEVGGE